MNDAINSELLKMQDELTVLDNAVKYIEKAGTLSNETIAAIRDVQTQYASHLEKMNTMLNAYVEEIKSHTETKLNEVTDSHKQQIGTVTRLLEHYEDLAAATARLPEEINKIDFPVRLTKMDESLVQLNAGILATQKQVDTVGANMADDFAVIDQYDKRLRRQNRRIGLLMLLTLISVLASGALLFLNFFPKTLP